MPAPGADVSTVLVPGPWRHRFVAANGSRFHVAELGEGPLVLLLHGFPQFWWAWRYHLPLLAEAGFRAVAVDLRGYGASDKPPRGYDTATLAGDIAGVARGLGESQAVIVGHDWGGWLAWAMPTFAPRLTRGVACVGMAHPLRMRAVARAIGEDGKAQRRALSRVLAFQAPVLPERSLSGGDGVERILRAWGGPGYPSPDELALYRTGMQVPFVAHTSLEYFRWAIRSLPRRDGRSFAERMHRPIDVPVLAVGGELDPYVTPSTLRGSSAWVRGPYREVIVPGAGHYLPEEAPEELTEHLLAWLKGLPDLGEHTARH